MFVCLLWLDWGLRRYAALTNENERLTSEILHKQAQLENINARIADAEESLSRDRWRDEGVRLESQIGRLQSQLDELREESRQAKMDPAEMRDRLYSKVKADNEKLLNTTRMLKALEEENDSKRAAIADLDTDLEERKGESGDSHKFEVLYQRDQDITKFINEFPGNREKALADKKRAQDTISALLEHISTELDRQHNMPSSEQVDAMRKDAVAKGTELENAQTTHERLQGELLRRKAELEKISVLDLKIQTELKSLTEKMDTMKSEMVTFANIDELKHRAEAVAASLEDRRSEYLGRRDMVRQQVNQVASAYERSKARLETSETSKGLEALEGGYLLT